MFDDQFFNVQIGFGTYESCVVLLEKIDVRALFLFPALFSALPLVKTATALSIEHRTLLIEHFLSTS